ADPTPGGGTEAGSGAGGDPGPIIAGPGAGGASGDQTESFGGGTGNFADMDAALNSLNDKKDSLADLSQEHQLKMQMAMDRLTKAESAASNLQKKISDPISSIIQNMK